MPADNLNGFRPDAIAALRQINMGFWRYGGNYTSNLIWYHVVGKLISVPQSLTVHGAPCSLTTLAWTSL